MIFISLSICILLFLRSKPDVNTLLDPLTLFFVGLLYYGFLIPISMILSGERVLPFMDSALIVNAHDIDIVSILLVLGYIGFLAGYRVFTPREFVDTLVNSADRPSDDQKLLSGRPIIVILLLLTLTLLIFYFKNLIGITSSYNQKVLLHYEGSGFSFIYGLTLQVLIVFLVWKSRLTRHTLYFGVISSLLIFCWSLATFSKQPMIYGGLILFATAAKLAPWRQIWTFWFAIGVAAFLLFFFIPAFSIYRATGSFSFLSLKALSLPFLYSDANGPFSVLILSVKNEVPVHLGPLVQSFVLWIPRDLWASRPLDAAEAFARAIMLDWQPGYGLGFSPFAEAKIRFGIVLSPILLFLAGMSLSALQRWALRLVSPPLAPALLLVVQGYILFTFHRGTFSGIFTSMMQFWVPFIGLSYMISLIFRLNRPTSAPQ